MKSKLAFARRFSTSGHKESVVCLPKVAETLASRIATASTRLVVAMAAFLVDFTTTNISAEEQPQSTLQYMVLWAIRLLRHTSA